MTNSTGSESDAQASWEYKRGDASFVDPLLDCLVFLAKLEGRQTTADALKVGLPLVDGYLTPDLFSRAASRAELSSRLVKRDLSDISHLVLPTVLLLNKMQACVLLSIDEATQMASVVQPESGGGETLLPLAELLEAYSGYAIFVKPHHRFDDRAPEVNKLSSRHWFWGTLTQSWRIYRDVLAASLLINLFALSSPLFVMNVYDRVVPNNAIETMWVLAIGISLLYVFDFAMKMLRGYFIDVAGKKSDLLLSSMIYERVLGMKMEVRPPSVGAFASNLREFDSIREFIASASIATLVDLPFVFIFLFVIWLIGGPIVWVGTAIILLTLLYGLLIQRPLKESVESTYRASAQKNAILIESLSNIESVKFLGAESFLQRNWEQMTGHIAHWGVRSKLLSSSAVNFAGFLQQFSQVGVIVTGVYLVVEGELTMGALIACVMLTSRAVAPVGQVANLSVRYFHAKTALSSLNTVMEMPIECPEDKSFLSRPVLNGAIEFDDVSFEYPDTEVKVLSGVSFKINPGEHVAIIGRVGSGKSTLQKLIQGLYSPSDGAVRIDDTDVRQLNPADVRHNMGYVPQESVLFFGSIRDNIVMGHPHVDDQEIIRVAELAGVSRFTQQHPQGFDMEVGERGDNLSGGQRQAVSVARAFLHSPNFYLMDEPTNSMDNTSEAALKRQIAAESMDKTLIVVTHRSSLLDIVDRIIVLDQGKVVADGKKEHVLQLLKEGRLKTS